MLIAYLKYIYVEDKCNKGKRQRVTILCAFPIKKKKERKKCKPELNHTPKTAVLQKVIQVQCKSSHLCISYLNS